MGRAFFVVAKKNGRCSLAMVGVVVAV